MKTTVTADGRSLAYIEATLGDIAAANALAHEVLGRCLDEMPPQTRRLLALVERMVAERCTARKIERADVLFRARELREFTGWGNSQLHVHLGRLVELEYVLAHRADYGQGFVYELVYDGQGKDGRRFLPGLIDPAKLDRPGVAVDHPAPVRPVSGPLPGPVRPAERSASPSENAPGVASASGNAHQDRAALVAAS